MNDSTNETKCIDVELLKITDTVVLCSNVCTVKIGPLTRFQNPHQQVLHFRATRAIPRRTFVVAKKEDEHYHRGR